MDAITIGEVIALVDEFKPNTRTPAEKIKWLNDLDFTVKTDIIDTHEGGENYPFDGYNEDTPLETPLLIPAQFGRDIYRFYLETQIDYVNKEYNSYNAAAAVYDSHYQSFALYWHNHHKPLQKNNIHF